MLPNQSSIGIAVLLLLITSLAFAQKPPIKFGDISMEDLQMTVYAPDSTAAAVILADYGEARISPFQGKLIFERHTRIKILKPAGTSWADVSVDLFHDGSSRETISGLKAITYNLENGKIVETKMSNDAVFEEKFNKYVNIKKFSLANVKPGSVIEYTYKVNSDFVANYPNWKFQYTIPCAYSEYRAYIPSFFIFERYMQGYLTPKYAVKNIQQSGYSDNMHQWIMINAPAYVAEPFMTSDEDYISRMNFALAYTEYPGQPRKEIMGTWEKLVGSYMGSDAFGKAITGSNFLKKTVEELIAGKTTPEEKIETIYNYVKTNVEWDGTKDILADNLKDILEKKKGTSGDINVLLASMLEKAGFKVEPILLSTRDHGFIRRAYPMQRQLNYVVINVNLGDNQIFLDATEKNLPMNVLPERCLNGEGILIQEKIFKWINLESKYKSRTAVTAKMKLNSDGEFEGNVVISKNGYDALLTRDSFTKKNETEYVNDLATKHGWEIQTHKFEGMKELDKTVQENFDVALVNSADVVGDNIYFTPLLNFPMKESPFKLETRTYPVDFGSPFERTYVMTIEVPEGYEVDEIPQSKAMTLPNGGGRFLYNAALNGNVINITSVWNLNKSIFLVDEYPLLREFYAQTIAKQNEQVVLRKIK